MVAETLAALDALRGAGSPVVGEGVAADGLIVVHTGLPGRVTGIDLDPAALRLGVEELAAELTAATNAALADLQAQAGVRDGAVDLDTLGARLREIQERTARQFSAFTDTLLEAQEKLDRRAGGPR
jgi:hypothetical protein